MRAGFWSALDGATAVLEHPSLPQRWEDESALPEMTTGELAAHLVRATGTLVTYLAGPPPTGPAVSAPEYFATVLADPSDLASPVNEGIRQRSREGAAPGPQAVLRRWSEATSAARRMLDDVPADRLVSVAGGLALTIDDYLATRAVELVLHTDDLAVSLALAPPPDPAPEAAELVARTLIGIARVRHGDLPVLRAMARRERQPCGVLQVF